MQGVQRFDKRSCLVAMSIGGTLDNAADAGLSAAVINA
jgi:hypothetical protein